MLPGRFKAVRCGRRWGKTAFEATLACDAATKGRSVGFFAPDYRILSETFNEILDILAPIKRSSSKVDGLIRTVTGGRIDFWTLENERAGRSRKYHLALVDEAAFTKANMLKIWQTAIKPALLDYVGEAVVASTPNGTDPDNFFYEVCNNPEHGFVEYHAPTHSNPFLPLEELAKLENENHPLVYKQEYLAEFVDWSGIQFFNIHDMLENERPVEVPGKIDAVFAVLDTASKTGKKHDGTAISYYGISKYIGRPVLLLDWDILQISGDLLETWLPTVFENLEALAKQYNARMGSQGVHIEDKNSGTVLIQQAIRNKWPARAINSKLTSLGKDERAISVSGYVYRKQVGISKYAFEKVSTYKGHTMNHFLHQVSGFKIGVENQEDDMLDTFCYAVAMALGNAAGF